uniref:Ricin B lectin domain-containing protein n=2 Tax=Populus trichocarpa TaxID=3694 RepID=A0A2K1ZVW3_POPTR|eukprot:XP_024459288.1 ricin-like [Populus trichocarpa]
MTCNDRNHPSPLLNSHFLIRVLCIQTFNMKQLKGNMKLWIVVAAYLLSTVLVASTEAGNMDSLAEDQTGRDMIIRSVVPKNDDVVSGSKSTQHIVGINNLCVDVFLELYFDGNLVQLYPCKSDGDVNQQWSLEKNGTIQSKGKCLATNGTSPGSYVFISDCNKVKASATIWKVQKDGSILNPSSSLVLTSKSGKSGSLLTLETNVYALRQGWRFTDVSKPSPKSIVGLWDYCLEFNKYVPKLAKCVENKTEQKWNFYADGSIRLDANTDLCLTSNGNTKGSLVLVVSCSPVSSNQRWTFGDSHGTAYFPILNVNNALVLDVSYSILNLFEIIIWKFNGGANQVWRLS